MTTTSSNSLAGDLTKVRRDLEETQRHLSRWYDHGSPDAREQLLHSGLEALMRAVSTLTLTVGRLCPDQQHTVPEHSPFSHGDDYGAFLECALCAPDREPDVDELHERAMADQP